MATEQEKRIGERFRKAQEAVNKHLIEELEDAVEKKDWSRAISRIWDLNKVNQLPRGSGA